MRIEYMEADSIGAIDDICVASGLSIYRRPEWTDINSGGDYRFTISLIGENIIYTQPSGYATTKDVKKLLGVIDGVVSETLPENSPYIHISDYSRLRGASLEGRKYYIEFMKEQPRLRGLFFFGMSSLLKMSIKIALRFNAVKFDVKIVDNLSEAIEMALRSLPRRTHSDENTAKLDVVQRSPAISEKKPFGETITHSDWSVSFNDFSALFEIINGDIFHWTSTGSFKAEQISPIFAINEQAMASRHRPDRPYYYLLGVEEIRNSSFKARKEYAARTKDWYERYPFKMFVFYGANRILKAAINLVSPFVPFKVCIAKDLDSALTLIEKDRSDSGHALAVSVSSTCNVTGDPDTPDPVQGYVDEIIHYLGSIDWEADGVDNTKKVDLNHPFSPVFDAIRLIKVELDEQFHERKRSEEARAKLSAQLQRKHRLEAIGTLAGGVAHDLNNILSGIVSYPEVLLIDIPEDSPLRKPILTIQKSGQKAVAIVQDLLTLARREVSVTEVVNLNRIVSEYLKSPEYENMISYHPEIQLEASLTPHLLNIYGSPVHISKSIMNLVSNAVEAMAASGKMTLSTENRYIDIPVTGYDTVEEGDYVVLSVSDTGVGIPHDDIDRIFEPFYTKKAMGRSGTGLGMAVVYGTVKDHRGYIDVISEEGKGTTFTLFFPATRKEAVTSKPLPLESYKSKGETILVVDDVAEQREIASKMLRKLGYSVVSVASGEAAIEFLKKESVDLLLLDMVMEPGIDGLDTYKDIIGFRPGQKAIIASGYSETGRVKEARDLGVGAYVRKPYMMEDIGMAVRKELDKVGR